MRENLLKQRDTNIKSAQKYMQKYLQDLQKHFGLDNQQLMKILTPLIPSPLRRPTPTEILMQAQPSL